MTTLSQLSYIVQQDCQLDSSRPIIIGVSGGPDSLCLLDVLCKLGYSLIVAHLNHGLRVEATQDAQLVKEAAQARKLPFILEEVDIHAFASNHGLSTEEAARIVRYRFLFEQAHQAQAQAVAVAHTADDQVETVLMHLLRGSGLPGLKGMDTRMLPNPWSEQIPLVRPFLGIFREEILAYCSEFDLKPVFDRTNLDTTLFRNRIRKELMPSLETYNPNIKKQLWRMARILAGDDWVLESITGLANKNCFLVQSADSIAINAGVLFGQPLGIQRRLIRQAIASLRPGLRDVDFSMIERTLSFAREPARNAEIDLADGLRLVMEGEKLWIANWEKDIPAGDNPHIDYTPLQVAIPGWLDLPGGWRLMVELVQDIHGAIDQASMNTDPYRAWIDILDNQPVFTIRPTRPGDRFQPLGMGNHSIKLSDFFINVKVLRRLRRSWPLVCLGETIVWVPGYRVAHPFRLTPTTKQAVFLRLFMS